MSIKTLKRFIALQRHPLHDPAFVGEVVDRVMQGAAVVPHGDRIVSSFETARIVRLDHVL